jgi:uncharacterized protein HemX
VPQEKSNCESGETQMKKIAVLVLAILGIFGVIAAQQTGKTYTPNEVQMLRLQLKQKEALLAQRDLQEANRRFQTAVGDLQAEAEKIKTDQKWPKTVVFNPDTLTFTELAPVPAPAKP